VEDSSPFHFPSIVIPANAAIELHSGAQSWTPAAAGVTNKKPSSLPSIVIPAKAGIQLYRSMSQRKGIFFG